MTADNGDPGSQLPDGLSEPSGAAALLRGRNRAGLYWRLAIAGVVVLAAIVLAFQLTGSGSPDINSGLTVAAPDGDSADGHAVFSPDGTLVAATGAINGGQIYLWNALTGRYMRTFPLPGAPGQYLDTIAFTTDDKKLIAAYESGAVYQLDVSSGQASLLGPGLTYPTATTSPNVALSGDGTTLAVIDPAGDGADVWDLATGARIAELTDPDKARLPVRVYGTALTGSSQLSLDRDGGRLTVTDPGGRVYVWDVAGKRVIAMFRYNAAAASSSGAAAFLSPDGKTVFIPYSTSGPVDSLWGVGTQSDVTPAAAQWGNPSVLFFSGDSHTIATQYVTAANAIATWNATTHSRESTFPYTDTRTALLAISPDGRKLLLVNSDESYISSIP